MNNNNNLGKSAAFLTLARMSTLLISLVSSMLLSRYRTLNEYGTFSQLTLTVSLSVSIFTLGLPNSINYFLAKAETSPERNNFLSIYYTLSTFLCAVMGIILSLGIHIIEDYFSNDLISSFAFFLAIYPWTTVTISSVSNVLVVYGQTNKLMFLNIVTAITTLISILITKALGLSFKEYLIIFLVGQVLVSIWIYGIVNQLDRRLKVKYDSIIVKQILSYSIPMGFASIIGTINVQIDKLMIGRLFDTESLAIYTNAGKELPLTIVAASLTAVLLPRMVKYLKDKNQIKAIELWGYTICLSYIIICFFVMLSIVFAPQIMSALYSDKYLPGVTVFRIYSLVLLLRTTYFGIVLNALGKTSYILWSSIASLSLNALLNYLLFLVFGFIGPAIATFLSILLVAVWQLLFTSRMVGIPFSNILPWKEICIISIINVVMGIVVSIFIKLITLGTDTFSILIAFIICIVLVGIYVIIVGKQGKMYWRGINE